MTADRSRLGACRQSRVRCPAKGIRKGRPARPPGIPVAIVLVLVGSSLAAGALTSAQIEKLDLYAQATVRYFTSPEANNLSVSFPHAFFGSGKFQACSAPGDCREETWSLTRGYGSHVNINEVTLRLVSLAAAYKMDWLTYLAPAERYAASWGQVLAGLQTLRSLQTSGNTYQYRDGHFHRTYLTTIERSGVYDVDRTTAEIVRPDNEDVQSSDDNALPFMNLLVLEGLARDPAVSIPGREQVAALCQAVRSDIDLRGFLSGNKVVHEIRNGIRSSAYWNRLSAEGAIILAALLVSGSITEQEFESIYPSLEDDGVSWPTCSEGTIRVDKPSYHAAMFIHALRPIHGMPVTPEELPGLSFFDTSTLPVFAAQLDYARCNALHALGTLVMTQTLNGTPVFERNNKQVQFAGNEDGLSPSAEDDLSFVTGPHAWFVALQRASSLAPADVEQLFAWMLEYESEFFHSGSDVSLGWEAAIPWVPGDRTNAWRASDGTWKYTDWGRPFEALNAAYIVLSIFDALNPDAPLASFSVEADQIQRIAYFLDNGCWPCSSTTVSASDGAYANKVRVTWGLVTGATKYEIHRATALCGTYSKIRESTAGAYDDLGVSAGRVYWYKIKACNLCGCGDWSDAESGYAGGPGAGTPSIFRIDSAGDVRAEAGVYGSCYYSGSADVAEWVQVSEPVAAGDVLELDPLTPGRYRRAVGPCSSLVAGVVSTQPALSLGGVGAEGQALLALAGMVPVKACDESGPIALGDLVVPSSIPGYVMRWDERRFPTCTPVGKALQELDGGMGAILILLMR